METFNNTHFFEERREKRGLHLYTRSNGLTKQEKQLLKLCKRRKYLKNRKENTVSALVYLKFCPPLEFKPPSDFWNIIAVDEVGQLGQPVKFSKIVANAYSAIWRNS